MKATETWRSEAAVHVAMRDHPAFPVLHGVYRAQAHRFFVMECGVISLCMSLSRDAIRFYGGELVRLSVRLCHLMLTCVVQLLALHALHQRGIVHLDIKPDNVVIGSDGHLLVIDFGIAERLNLQPDLATPVIWTGNGNAHCMSGICGTRGYLSPEVYRDTVYSYAVDLWSLGATMHAWLTTKPPLLDRSNDEHHRWAPYRAFDYLPTELAFFERILAYIEPVAPSRTLPMFPLERFADYDDIKADPLWDLDWAALENRTLAPPQLHWA
ncbi:kinase-like domain-containing protein, partial [Mycena crocata]